MMHKMATSYNIQDLLGFWREALGSTSMKVNWLPSFLFLSREEGLHEALLTSFLFVSVEEGLHVVDYFSLYWSFVD